MHKYYILMSNGYPLGLGHLTYETTESLDTVIDIANHLGLGQAKVSSVRPKTPCHGKLNDPGARLLEHSVNGIRFTCRADLKGGVAYENKSRYGRWSVNQIAAASAAFGAWHSMEIRDTLNSFSGYDSVTFK